MELIFASIAKAAQKGCSFTQHYECYTNGNNSTVIYYKNCLEFPYFLSTSMTAFAMEMLSTLSAEILIGQMSYQQDIYNYVMMQQ